MPELPDVETFRRYYESTALHKRIKRVETLHKKILKGVSPEDFAQTLEGRTSNSTMRHGKNLLVQMDKGPWLRFHFGMTGSLQFLKKDEEGIPLHTRVIFEHSDGSRLAFLCIRMLGRTGLVEDPESFAKSAGLGPDAMEISLKEFRAMLSSRTGAIKSVLMDQGVIAGLGNVYSDEVLFHAGFHPRRKISQFSTEDLSHLYRVMHRVMEMAIKKKAEPEKMPSNWLLPHRKEGVECPDGKGKIKRLRFGSRSAYYCNECQKE